MKFSPELQAQLDLITRDGGQGACALMWFRDDLRLSHNEALFQVCDHARPAGDDEQSPVVAVFVHETNEGFRPLGGATRWWLHHSLTSLAQSLAERGIPLIVAGGDSEELIPALVDYLQAGYVAWSRRYHRPFREADARIKEALKGAGVQAESFEGYVLTEPWTIVTAKNEPYKVFTPYSKQAFAVLAEEMAVPPSIFAHREWGAEIPADHLAITLRAIEELKLLPQKSEPDWTAGLEETWTPGERGAHQRLTEFLDHLERGDVANYSDGRDFPAQPATSNLSPHLRFGEISPHYLWHAVGNARADNPEDITVFRKELLWRDFAWNRLYHRPDLPTVSVKEEFRAFPWAWDPGAAVQRHTDGRKCASASEELRAWRAGETGIPLVDAGMKQLWVTGTMHNRVRMVVGSLLTKNLMTHWRHGEEWFWDQLVDADHASNAFNWQWVAGCGDDAAPYFRIFNPETQAKRFDPEGEYIARWAPEALLPGYIQPIVDLKDSREEALSAYQQVRAIKQG